MLPLLNQLHNQLNQRNELEGVLLGIDMYLPLLVMHHLPLFMHLPRRMGMVLLL